MKEGELKTELVGWIRAEGGYGRRIEDQFAVGIFDLVLIPMGGPVFFVEAKIIRASTWGATTRQMIELQRVQTAGREHVIACEMGFDLIKNTITLRHVASDCTLTRPRGRGMMVSSLLTDLAGMINARRHDNSGTDAPTGVTGGSEGPRGRTWRTD